MPSLPIVASVGSLSFDCFLRSITMKGSRVSHDKSCEYGSWASKSVGCVRNARTFWGQRNGSMVMSRSLVNTARIWDVIVDCDALLRGFVTYYCCWVLVYRSLWWERTQFSGFLSVVSGLLSLFDELQCAVRIADTHTYTHMWREDCGIMWRCYM